MIDTKPLGEVVKLRKGKKAAEVHEQRINGSKPYIQIDEVRGTAPETFASDPTGVEVNANDLCIVWDGANAGTVGYGIGGLIGSTVARMRVIRPDEWDTRFIGRLLQSKFQELNEQAQSRGATIPHVNRAKLEEISLPRIAKKEQQRIASILDKADSIRRKREETITAVDTLLRAAFLQTFGDPFRNPFGFGVQRIEEHLSKERPGTQSGPFGSVLKKHEHTDSGIPVWGVDNVQSNEFVDGAKLFISEAKFEQLERYSVELGDILISRAGTVGRMCIAEPRVDKSIISTNLVRVVLDTKSLLPEYFVSLFTHLPHRLGTLKANNKENAFTFLNPRTLKALEIAIPPIELQQEYRVLTHAVKTQVAKAKKQLRETNELFASLSQRAFRRKL